jgi:cellulose synthase/poly-beta-1,6-N-acetylglucosamine synthase-like glycosyltransferase
MLDIFFVLAALLVLQSLMVLRDAKRFLAFVQHRLSQPAGTYAPPATLICPCKGLDPELETNLRSLFAQDYPDPAGGGAGLEILLVVAGADDPARALCEKLIAEASRPARLVVAGPPSSRGEKVNNLLAGVAAARPESEVFVFADSDGRPAPGWVRTLVSGLADEHAGAASTFRWYIPERNFLSGLQSAWNGPALTYMSEPRRNFLWGGGMAIRRTTFYEAKVPRYWAGCISDDLMMTRALRDAGKRIVFMPECLVATHHRPRWRELLEWTTRQVLLLRVYEPRLWWPALGMHVFYCGVFLLGLGLAAAQLDSNPRMSAVLLLTLAGIAALGVATGALRLQGVFLLLPEHSESLRRTWWSPTLQAVLVPWLMMSNFIASAWTRRMTWRGVTYELISPWETRIEGES